MSAPNIVAVATITGKTVGKVLTASSVDILTNAAASGKVFKINSITVANVDGATNFNVTCSYFSAADAVAYRKALSITVPAQATLVLTDKNSSFYLLEGDKVQAFGSTASKLEMVIGYEEIS